MYNRLKLRHNRPLLANVGWLCLTSHRQQGHLETAPSFTVPCEGRECVRGILSLDDDIWLPNE